MRTKSRANHLSPIAALLIPACCAIINAGASMTAFADPIDEPNGLRWDLADAYQLTWESVQLSSSLSNPDQGDKSDGTIPDRTLTLSLRLRILDTNDVVGIVRSPMVLQALDASGSPIPFQFKPQAYTYLYEPLGWDAKTSYPRDWPASLIVQLGFDPNQLLPSSISSLKGYLDLLYAQDKVNADVPFAIGDWIEVLPDLEIRVTEHTAPPPGPLQTETIVVGERPTQYSLTRFTGPLCVYSYETITRSKTGGCVLGLGMSYWPPLDTTIDYAVIKTQLTQSGKKDVFDVYFMEPRYDPDGGIRSTGGCGQSTASWDTIRHRIAVKPYPVKVPFALTNIPIPAFQPSSE